MHPNRHVRSQQRRTVPQIRKTDACAFFDLLTDEATLDQVESLLPVHRERLLPPTETLAMFMAQTLNADRSCQNAINEFSARRVAGGLRACSTSTAACCRARKCLPQWMVSSLVCFTGHRLGERDHLIDLEKPKVRPSWMTEKQFAQAPNRLTVRELQVSGKTLVTTSRVKGCGIMDIHDA